MMPVCGTRLAYVLVLDTPTDPADARYLRADLTGRQGSLSPSEALARVHLNTTMEDGRGVGVSRAAARKGAPSFALTTAVEGAGDRR
ncbi:hypothetical protein EAO70_26395 [Streptomyces sp. adm13(2018)]|nr:hypothetical protein EAO70_26395 [Streptomyces sp. adm13(2018)]